MPAEPQRAPLPFEPSKKRQKPAKKSQSQSDVQSKKNLEEAVKTEPKPPFSKEEMSVPKIVSDRMARRMAIFCGVPTFLGMMTFVASYIIVSQGWFKPPNVAVVLVSMGFFGLGVLGLTYGILSASWDEETSGSKVGWGEFKTNWGRMVSVWRSSRQVASRK